MTRPGTCRMATDMRDTKSRRKYAARRMCLVFLNAIGSNDMSTADLESDHSTHGPSHLAPRSTSKSRSHRMSRAAIMAPKYSASALLNDTERCILENQ